MSDSRRDERAPLALKVRFKSADLNEFIEHYSYDISKGGLFIKTKKPLEIGTLLKFELQLKDTSRIIEGVGRVAWCRRPNELESLDRPAGMGIKFIKMSSESKAMVDVIVKSRGDGPSTYETGDPKEVEKFTEQEKPTQEVNLGAIAGGFDPNDEPTNVRTMNHLLQAISQSEPEPVANQEELVLKAPVGLFLDDDDTMLAPSQKAKSSTRVPSEPHADIAPPPPVRRPSQTAIGLPEDLAAQHPSDPAPIVKQSKVGMWGWLLLVLAAAGIGWWYFNQGKAHQGKSEIVPPAAEPNPPPPPVEVTPLQDAGVEATSDASVATSITETAAPAEADDMFEIHMKTKPINAQVIVGGQVFRGPVTIPLQKSKWKSDHIEVFIRKKGYASRVVHLKWTDFAPQGAANVKDLEVKLEEEE